MGLWYKVCDPRGPGENRQFYQAMHNYYRSPRTEEPCIISIIMHHKSGINAQGIYLCGGGHLIVNLDHNYVNVNGESVNVPYMDQMASE